MITTHRKFTSSLAILAAALIAVVSSAAEANTWAVRVRATYLDMSNKSDAFSALGINFASDSVHVNSKMIPEVDISYFITPQVTTELVLTIPQNQNVSLAGVGNLGSFKHLPPTLLAQYRFITPSDSVHPYVGAGVNYTLIWDSNLSVAGIPLALDHNSFGFAVQAGVDYDIGNNQFINVDVKKVGIESDVYVAGSRLTTAKLNPWLFSLGYGWKF